MYFVFYCTPLGTEQAELLHVDNSSASFYGPPLYLFYVRRLSRKTSGYLFNLHAEKAFCRPGHYFPDYSFFKRRSWSVLQQLCDAPAYKHRKARRMNIAEFNSAR